MNDNFQEYYEESSIDLGKIKRTIIKEKNNISYIIFTFLVVSIIYSLWVTPVYRASATLSFQQNTADSQGLQSISAVAARFSGLASLGGINIAGTSSNRETSIATLDSRVFSERFIKEENLLPVLYEDDWNSETKQWKDPSSPPSMAKAVRMFSKLKKVNIDIKTGLITITVDWKDPNLASDWTNGMINAVNIQLQEKAIGDSKRNILFLNEELASINNIELTENIYTLIQDETNKMMIASTREEYAFNIIDPAIPPDLRYSPKRRILVMSAGLISVFVSMIYVLILARNEE